MLSYFWTECKQCKQSLDILIFFSKRQNLGRTRLSNINFTQNLTIVDADTSTASAEFLISEICFKLVLKRMWLSFSILTLVGKLKKHGIKGQINYQEGEHNEVTKAAFTLSGEKS